MKSALIASFAILAANGASLKMRPGSMPSGSLMGPGSGEAITDSVCNEMTGEGCVSGIDMGGRLRLTREEVEAMYNEFSEEDQAKIRQIAGYSALKMLKYCRNRGDFYYIPVDTLVVGLSDDDICSDFDSDSEGEEADSDSEGEEVPVLEGDMNLAQVGYYHHHGHHHHGHGHHHHRHHGHHHHGHGHFHHGW